MDKAIVSNNAEWQMLYRGQDWERHLTSFGGGAGVREEDVLEEPMFQPGQAMVWKDGMWEEREGIMGMYSFFLF